MTGWLVVNMLPHQEGRAESHLLRQGYRGWLPLIRWVRWHAHRMETRPALDPVQRTDNQKTAALGSAAGVRRLFCHRDRPTPIPATLIDSLRWAIDDGGVVAIPEPTLRPGQNVRLLMGPFVLYLAVKDRVRPLPGILGQNVSTTAWRRMVAPVA
jgi:transcriptional antiterminator RfaH